MRKETLYFTQELRDKLCQELCEVLFLVRPEDFSFLTFNVPPNVTVCELASAARVFLKNVSITEYFYTYEVSEAGHVHMHMVCNVGRGRWSVCKNSWYKVLGKRLIAEVYEKCTLEQSLDCRGDMDMGRLREVVNYMLKCKEVGLVSQRTGVYKFGGNQSVRRVLSGYPDVCNLVFARQDWCMGRNEMLKKVKESEGHLDLTSKDLKHLYNTAYESYISNRTQGGFGDDENIDESEVHKEVHQELSDYHDHLSKFDLRPFVAFLQSGRTSVGSYYMDLYALLNMVISDRGVINRSFDLGGKICGYLSKTKVVYREFLMKLLTFEEGDGRESMTGSMKYLFLNTLFYMFKASGTPLMSLLRKLGKFLMDYGGYACADTLKDKVHVGHYMYSLVRGSLVSAERKLVDYTEWGGPLVEEVSKDWAWGVVEDAARDFRLEMDPEIALSVPEARGITVYFDFNLAQVRKALPKFDAARLRNVVSLTVHKPMRVIPKKWIYSVEKVVVVRDDSKFLDLTQISNGGLVLNGVELSLALCKQSDFSDHKFLATPDELSVINKMQEIPYTIDADLLSFYQFSVSHNQSLHGFLSSSEMRSAREEMRNLYSRLVHLRKQKRDVAVVGGNTGDVLGDLNKLWVQRKLINEKLVKHRTSLRLLSAFGGIDYSPHYYAYQLDFRGRKYPVPHETSFVATKFGRSLIRFMRKERFDLREFKLYAASQWADTRGMSEYDIMGCFDTDVLEVLRNSSLYRAKINSCRSPYMFYACVVEWGRYESSVDKEGYMSDFPIYYDCTAQGPQLATLLVGVKKFSRYLNLCAQDKTEGRGDFYEAVISQFLVEMRGKTNAYTIKAEDVSSRTLHWLRKHLKNLIMTIFYGVSMRKFLTGVESMCVQPEAHEVLSTVFVYDTEKIREFVVGFSQDFWAYTHGLPIFQMKVILSAYCKYFEGDDMQWSVFNKTIVKPRYLKTSKHQIDSKVLKERYQFVVYDVSDKVLRRKQHSSILANFTHSFDAYVSSELQRCCDFPVMSIHDSFGVHGCNVEALREALRGIYEKIRLEGFDSFTRDMAESLEKSVGKAACLKFMKVVRDNPKEGGVSKEDLEGAHHFISPA